MEPLVSSGLPQAEDRAAADGARSADRALLALSAALSGHGLGHGARVGLAVSGGLDSRTLLETARRLPAESRPAWTVLHVHHGLRGEEADGDERFVAALAAEAGFRFAAVRGTIPRPGRAVEEQARELRLAALARLAHGEELAAVMLAHHEDDQAETVLHRVLRGAGVFGLAGMAPARALPGGPILLRPWLGLSRPEIAAAARELGLRWREDSSNRDLRHLRNELRHGVLAAGGGPDLDLRARVLDAAATARSLRGAIERHWEEHLESPAPATLGGIAVWKRRLASPPPHPALSAGLLHRLLGRPPRQSEVLLAHEALSRGEGTIPLARGGALFVQGHYLLVEAANPAAIPSPPELIRVPDEGSVLVARDGIRFALRRGVGREDSRHASFPAILRVDHAEGLHSRTPLPGETWEGKGGRAELRESLRAAGVPARLRPHWPVIADARGVLWAPGLPVAARARSGGCAIAVEADGAVLRLVLGDQR